MMGAAMARPSLASDSPALPVLPRYAPPPQAHTHAQKRLQAYATSGLKLLPHIVYILCPPNFFLLSFPFSPLSSTVLANAAFICYIQRVKVQELYALLSLSSLGGRQTAKAWRPPLVRIMHMRNSEYSSIYPSPALHRGVPWVLPVRAWRDLRVCNWHQKSRAGERGACVAHSRRGARLSFSSVTLWESRCEDCVATLECNTRRALGFAFHYVGCERLRYNSIPIILARTVLHSLFSSRELPVPFFVLVHASKMLICLHKLEPDVTRHTALAEPHMASPHARRM
jgi:hypothetical protein